MPFLRASAVVWVFAALACGGGDAGTGGGASSSATGTPDPCATATHCEDGLLDCGEAAFDCGGDCAPCGPFDVGTVCGGDSGAGWASPHLVPVLLPTGVPYAGDVEEPEVRDFAGQRWLFFNDDPADGNKDLFYALWDDSQHVFVHQGPIGGAATNTATVDGNPSLDQSGTFYFVSTRTYPNPTETIHAATLDVGGSPAIASLVGVHRLANLSRPDAPWATQGVQVTWDGSFLYWDEAKFDTLPASESDIFAAKLGGTDFVRLSPDEQAMLLGNVNTPAFLEYAESLSHDGLEMYFTRTWFDATAPASSVFCVMRATRPSLDVGFGPALQVAATAASPGVLMEAPSLSPDEHTLYYHRRIPGDAHARLYAVER
jgi:hypothetical protein